MYSDIWYQVVLFLVFFCFGVICAFVFDAFRVSEQFRKSNFVTLAIKDILFWLIVLTLMFAICLRFNNGEIRFFMFLGMLLGASVYFNTVSKFVINIMFFVVKMLRNIIKIVVKVLLLPLKLLLKIFNKPVVIAVAFSKNSVKKIKFKLKKFKKFKR